MADVDSHDNVYEVFGMPNDSSDHHDVRQCVFLIGGLGSRLGEYTRNVPKPMLEVGGYPFLVWLVRNAVRFGFTDIVLLAGYKGDIVEEYFKRHATALFPHITIRVVKEEQPLGTGGALVHAAPCLDAHFVVCNGDSYFDCNLLRLAVPLFSPPIACRMMLRSIGSNTRYGTISVDGNTVTAFSPLPSQSGSSLINTGMYCFSRDFFASLPLVPLSLERDIFPQRVLANEVACVTAEGYFIDIGIPEDLACARQQCIFTQRRPAVFFARDGVLNHDSGYTYKADALRWIDGARDAVRWCNDHGCLVFVVTNQSGVPGGNYTAEDVELLHATMQNELRAHGAHVDEFIYCPHHEHGLAPRYTLRCDCRKPQAGMIRRLLERWPVAVDSSLLIGDKQDDLEAAARCGIATAHFTSGNLMAILRNNADRLRLSM